MTPKEELAGLLKRIGRTQDRDESERTKGFGGLFFDLLSYYSQRPQDKSGELIYNIIDDLQGVLSVLSITNLLITSKDRTFSKLELRALLQLFFFEINSIYEYLGTATCDAYGLPHKNTIHFSKKSRDENIVSKLGDSNLEKRMIDHLNNCEAFEVLNTWRNHISHRGQFIDVTPYEQSILIKLIGPGDVTVEKWDLIPKALKVRNDQVDVYVFIGFYAGRTLHYLNEWSAIIKEKNGITVSNGGYSGPFAAILEYAMKKAHDLL